MGETLRGFRRHDTDDDSTVSCPCGSAFTWSGFDAGLDAWCETHAPHTATPPEPTLDQTDMGRCWNCGDRKARCRCSPAHQAGPTPPEPAAPRVTPEDWQRLGEMQDTAREVGERLAEVRERLGLDAPEPDEAEREARAFLGTHYGRGHTTDVQYLATLLRAAEARGRERGVALAAPLYSRRQLEAKLAEAREVLRSVEWVSFEEGYEPRCPYCLGERYDPKATRHAPDCRLAAVLENS